jgi:hypothetical protein
MIVYGVEARITLFFKKMLMEYGRIRTMDQALDEGITQLRE